MTPAHQAVAEVTGTAATDARARPRMPRSVALAAALLLLAHAILIVLDARAMGLTTDESNYFHSGRVILRHGWVHQITRYQGPLPLYATQLLVRDFPPGGLSDSGQRGLILSGRLGTLPFALVSAVILFVWARRLFGDAGGLLSLLLYALHPVVLGYGSLMLVDAQHTTTVLLTLYALWRYLETRSPRWLPWIGVALGLALATKYLAVLLALPVGATVAVVAALPASDGSRRVRWSASVRAFLLVVLCAFVTLHAAYLFRAGLAGRDPAPFTSAAVRGVLELPVLGHAAALLPEPFLRGVDYQVDQGTREYRPFLNGVFAARHPATYALAILCKTPEVTLLCVALALFLRAPRLFRGGLFRESGAPGWKSALWATLPYALIAFGTLSASPMQLGIRYALPLLPLILLAAGALAWTPARHAPGPRSFALLVLLAALHARELAGAWPDWISYYNASSGGQRLAFRRFRDTNNDFGQHRRGAAERLRARHGELEVLGPRSGARFGRLAVANPSLKYDPQSPGGLVLTWLLWLEPVDHLGASWWLFELTPEDLERHFERTGGERLRRDLALAHLGAGRRADAERHLAGLGDELAAPLRRVIAAEDAARAQPTQATLEALITGWTEVGRLDRAVAVADEHATLLASSDVAALARVELLEEHDDFAGAARALDRDWSDPMIPAKVMRIRDLILCSQIEEAQAAFELAVRALPADKPLPKPLQWLGEEIEDRAGFRRLLR